MLTIHEKFSRHWPTAAIISGLSTLVVGLLWLTTEEILLEGYLRLATFCLFALTLLIALKLRQGQASVDLQVDEPTAELRLTYRFQNEQLGQQTYDLNAFDKIEIVEMPNRSLYNDFSPSNRTIRIQEPDREEEFYLFNLNDRVIPFDRETAERVADYLNHHQVQISARSA